MSRSATESRKKKREREALLLIYDEGSLASIKAAERPDFVLRHTSGSQPFGVEVTEIHYSETDARLVHIPNYALELIDGGPVRHKADAQLKVDTVEFTSADGTKKVAGRAIIQQTPPLSNYLGALESAIVTKSAKASDYLTGVSHVNLLIVDHAKRLLLAKPEALYTLLFSETMRAAVAQAPFNEIYLLTSREQGRKVFIPLRMLFLLSTVFLFHGAILEYSPAMTNTSPRDLLLYLHDYLTVCGVRSRLNDRGTVREIILGNTGIRIDEDWHVVVNDYADLLPVVEQRTPEQVAGPWRDQEFDKAFANYRATHIFKSTAAFDVIPLSGARTAKVSDPLLCCRRHSK